jgi:hypothetical protein
VCAGRENKDLREDNMWDALLEENSHLRAQLQSMSFQGKPLARKKFTKRSFDRMAARQYARGEGTVEWEQERPRTAKAVHRAGRPASLISTGGSSANISRSSTTPRFVGRQILHCLHCHSIATAAVS